MKLNLCDRNKCLIDIKAYTLRTWKVKTLPSIMTTDSRLKSGTIDKIDLVQNVMTHVVCFGWFITNSFKQSSEDVLNFHTLLSSSIGLTLYLIYRGHITWPKIMSSIIMKNS